MRAPTVLMLSTILLSFVLSFGAGACMGSESEDPAPGVACDERGAEIECMAGEVMLCGSTLVLDHFEDQWSECIPSDYACVPGDTHDCPGGGDSAGDGEVLQGTCAFGADGLPDWNDDNCYA